MLSITQNHLLSQYQDAKKKLLSSDSEPLDVTHTIPLQELLNADWISSLLKELQINYRDRVVSPWVTLWTFVTQVLSPDRSCQNAVNRWIAWLCSQKKKMCSSATGAYCKARLRLPDGLLQRLVRQLGLRLENQIRQEHPQWLWREKPVKLVDGTTVTLADTPANQCEYPQPKNRRKKGALGFPLLRILAISSLSSGAILDAKMGSYAGKGSGESSLFIRLWRESQAIARGDVLLMDRAFSSYLILGYCFNQGVDFVTRMLGAMRSENLETVKRLGRGDRIVRWRRPKPGNTSSDYEFLLQLPDSLLLREIVYYVQIPGFRTKAVTLLSSFVDRTLYQKEELAELYRMRWHCELDLRSIKSVMQMDQLTSRTPEMARKEAWAHLLGYNLVRTTMAQAAVTGKCRPRELSFKGALQTINAFRPVLSACTTRSQWACQYRNLLAIISKQTLLKRPNRLEPRAIRKRSQPYGYIIYSRAQARRQYWRKGTSFQKRARGQTEGRTGLKPKRKRLPTWKTGLRATS